MSNTEYEDGLWARIKELEAENKKLSEQLVICDRAIESLTNDRTEAYEIIDKLEAENKKLTDEILKLVKENDTLIHNSELEAAAHIDTLAKLEKSIAALQVQTEQATILARIDNKYVEALNKIGMLGMSEHAYTSEFTERVRSIITEALK